ncbi:MAG: hypothetical protein IJI68_13765, partial [Eggerthellaceae bacterium]|nr:hypothetical protein [Eggerthellaceae bacterium]
MARCLGHISHWKLATILAALSLTALALASAAAPAQAFAAELAASDAMAGSGAAGYEYYDAEVGQWKELPGSYEVVTQDNCDLHDVGWYVVSGDVAVNYRIDVGENARLVLCGGAELDAQGGIRVPAGSSLSVFAGRPAGSSGGIAGGTLL